MKLGLGFHVEVVVVVVVVVVVSVVVSVVVTVLSGMGSLGFHVKNSLCPLLFSLLCCVLG